MSKFILRRILTSIPTVLVISFVIFAILEVSPADPVASLPKTIPEDVRENIREKMGANDPFVIKYVKWLRQFLINEPLNLFEEYTGIRFGSSEERLRYLSWQTKSPITDLIIERLPQTIWVAGSAYLLALILAIPIGVLSAYKQYSIFDQVGTFVMMTGFSVPTFFTALVMIVIFSVQLRWLPSIYDTTLVVNLNDMDSVIAQLKQMFMPVAVLALFFTAQFSRFTRSSVLENLGKDYVRTARSKGLSERSVLTFHVLRNSMIPVLTLIALGIPHIFQGSIVIEQIFRVNGIGQLLISAIQGGDLPTVQALSFIYAVLIVIFNIVADIMYGFLDPRVVYN